MVATGFVMTLLGLPLFPTQGPLFWLGVLLGALAGLLVAYLLFNGVVVVPGWEGLFSMGPFAFHFFWVMMGIAGGILLMGAGTILAAGPRHEGDEGGCRERG